ncbi:MULTISPECIES: MerR family transcriptional regulator [unclassified Halomonas]|uniref:MerR family transcriptional regulator n=1 Tax=unclassified Halomonas TaxID=2609666 RepID=UPI0020767D43|nr:MULTISPECIES: MerR family transcriptional regulator [unclassified Halomonas]
MRIGEVAKRSGVSVRMLRYYEQVGLLAPGREAQGYRRFSDTDVIRAGRIRQLSDAGLTVEAIGELLPCVVDERPAFDPCPRIRSRLAQEVASLDRRIEQLARSRAVLSDYLGSLDT